MILLYLFQFSILMIAITIHEFSHGWAAYKLGDPTAKYSGRLTLNPIAHIDPMGTIMLPMMLMIIGVPPIGWAKPVPVNYMNLRNPKQDMLWVGLAGPVSNFLFAFMLLLIIKIFPQILHTFLGTGLFFGAVINIILGLFNLLPIPPLDGSQIVFSLLPLKYIEPYEKLRPYGIFIILALIWGGLIRKIFSFVIYFIIKYLGVNSSMF